jgi:RNA polymerase sigma factor (sigma-70 family)
VVERVALWVSRRFHGLVKPRELLAVGTFGLYTAARTYPDDCNDDFEDYAYRRVRDAMLKAVRAELFEHRVKIAAIRSADAYAAHFPEVAWSSLYDDEGDARRGLRTFFECLMASTFAGAVEEARRVDVESPTAVTDEYRRAMAALDEAMQGLSPEAKLLLLMVHRDGKTLGEAGEALDISYATVRRWHVAAFTRLHAELLARGVDRAPPPPDVP